MSTKNLERLSEPRYIQESRLVKTLSALYYPHEVLICQDGYYPKRGKTHPDVIITKHRDAKILVEVKKMLKPNYPSVCDITSKGAIGQSFTWRNLERKYHGTNSIKSLVILILLPFSAYGEIFKRNLREAVEIIETEAGLNLLLFNHEEQKLQEVYVWLQS